MTMRPPLWWDVNSASALEKNVHLIKKRCHDEELRVGEVGPVGGDPLQEENPASLLLLLLQCREGPFNLLNCASHNVGVLLLADLFYLILEELCEHQELVEVDVVGEILVSDERRHFC